MTLTPELIAAYRAKRAPYFPNSYPGKAFHTVARSALDQARFTVTDSKTARAWEEADGYVVSEYDASDDCDDCDGARVRIVERGDDLCFDDIAGDCYNPEVNKDINPNILKREEKEERERISSEGVWFYESQYWDGADWEHADSIGGFVGGDFKRSGYMEGLQRAALDALADCLKSEQAELDAKATAAACDLMASRPDMHGACL